MIYLVSLNEMTLFRFLVLITLKKNVKVLRIAPFMLMAKGLLKRLVEWSIRTGRSEYAVKLTPELQHNWDFPGRFLFKEVFKKYEPWQNKYYGFYSQHTDTDKSYGYAFKKITCSYTFWKVVEIYVLDAITKKHPASSYKVIGLLADTKELGRFLLGPSFAEGIRAMRYPRFIIYPTFVFLAFVYTLAWVLYKTRPSVRQFKVALIIDMMKDGREVELYKEIYDAGRCVLIDRFPATAGIKSIPEEMDAIIVRRTDGLFSVSSSIKGLMLAAADIIRIAHRYWDAPPALFFESLSFPYKRLLVRGMLNRYQPKAFIGRDEYNVDHILRRIELKRKDVKSIGLSNALFPCFASVTPNARYMSYDIYYVDAAPLFKQYLKTWAPDMDARTLGSFSLPRDKMASCFGGGGENILFTMRVAWNEPEMVRMVRAVAEAFPERMVFLQLKQGFVSEEHTQRLIKECGEGVPNFMFTTDDVYTLLNSAKYHISDISTFVAEAIRSGMVTFVADILDMEFSCYRLIPNLCSKNAEDLIHKIKTIEDGLGKYPHQEYFNCLGYNVGEVSFDILRKELNLQARKGAAL